MVACAKAALAHDIPIALGNDVGCQWIAQYDFWRELCYFHKYTGASNACALYCATGQAARLAGLSEVPCLLADVDEESSGMLALVENLQRRDLDYIEEAEGLQKLMQQYHLSQEQAARRIGKSQSAVANKLRILRHPPSVLQALRENHLTERHARALLKLPDEAERLRVIGLIAQGEWTVAKTEQYIDSLLAPRTPQRRELGGFVLRDVRLFLNSIDHQLDLVRAAGVGASRERQETEQEIVLTIRIPKSKAPLSRSR